MAIHRPSSHDENDERGNPQNLPGYDPNRRDADRDADPPGDDSAATPSSPYDNLFSRADVERDLDSPDDESRSDGDDRDRIGDDAILDDTDLDDDTEPEPQRPRLALIIGGVLLLAVLGVGLGVFLTRPGTPDDTQVIARVGESNITRSDFSRNYQPGLDPQQILDRLIQVELVVQAAQRDGVQIDQARVEQEVQGLRQQTGNEEQFQQFLKSNSITSENDLRTLIGRQQLIEAMVRKHTVIDQFRSSHILLLAEGEEAIARRKPEADALLAQAQNGGDFAALAREKSDDPGSKEKGGELGWVPLGVFVPEFEQAVAEMKQGEIRLVQSQYGWHIIKLEEPTQKRGLEDEQYFQSPSVQQAFADTFLPWAEGLQEEARKTNQINVLVPVASLIPTPMPLPSIVAPPPAAPGSNAPPAAPAPNEPPPAAPAPATPQP